MKKKTNIRTMIRQIVREEVAMAINEVWKTMGDGTYDSSKVNEVIGRSYGDMMKDSTEVNADAMVASMGVNPTEVDDSVKNIFTKDYRSVMKAIDKKKGVPNNG